MQRGDTIIEVIFAVTVFSMVAVGGLALMNQGAAMAQRSLEIGMVRDQMDAQADALRYLHGTYIANFGQATSTAKTIWADVTNHAIPASAGASSLQAFDQTSDGQRCTLKGPTTGPGSPFVIDLTALKTSSDPTLAFTTNAWNASVPTTDGTANDVTYAQVRYTGSSPVAQGIWIQAVKNPKSAASGPATATGYYDFNIYTCWLTPGQAAPVTLGTVVRLYDPAI